jgi:hypothetical protein
MVDAGERRSDQAQPPEKGNRVKYSTANTLRTQQFIAQYGKSARHPVCQAWVILRGFDAKFEEVTKEVAQTEKIVNSAKQQKEQVRGLYEQFYKEEGKQKEVIQGEALMREIGDLLTKTQTHYEEGVKLCTMLRESRPFLVVPFKREYEAVVRTKDKKALRALKLIKQRWLANQSGKGTRPRVGDQREFEILGMLRNKVVKAAWATKDEVGAGYMEAVRGGDRFLSDEVWQGRLTIREIHSRLMTAGGSRLAGDKDGKEIRRTMKRLGIRPAEEQRGRKWKSPLPQDQEPKRPRGRTRTKPEIKSMSLEAIQAMLSKTAQQGDGLRNLQIYRAGDESGLKWSKQVKKSIDREIARLTLLRGGRRRQFVY